MCGRLTELVSSTTAFLAPDTAALLAPATAAALAAGVTTTGVDALSCATFACPGFALRSRPRERGFVARPPVLPSWDGLAFGRGGGGGGVCVWGGGCRRGTTAAVQGDNEGRGGDGRVSQYVG